MLNELNEEITGSLLQFWNQIWPFLALMFVFMILMFFIEKFDGPGKSIVLMMLPVALIVMYFVLIEDEYNSNIEENVADYIGESVEYEFQSVDGYLIMNGDSGKHYSIVYNEEDDKVLESKEISYKEYTLLKESDEEKRAASSSSDPFFIPIFMGR